ncbi:Ig-like domain-containing protein [Orbus wheelerorum]|uniref:Ig-like domain-containing protein n=1 Tax=Orbus wheelerorum TaxID=3074111 RepID=UPI00370D5C80
MVSLHIIDRKNGSKQDINSLNVHLNDPKIVMLDISRDEIEFMQKIDGKLLIKLKSGEVITIENFFELHEGYSSELIINDQVDGGIWWIEEPVSTNNWLQIDNLEPLMIAGDSSEFPEWIYWAGAALVGTVAAVSSGGGGGGSKDINRPQVPTVEQNNGNGLLGGTSSPGSTITLTKPDGSTETTIAGEDGKWGFEPNPLGNGEKGTLTTTDKDGNKSDSIDTGVADTLAPDAPSVNQNNNESLAGKGEAGSTITLTKEDGSKETTVADKDGNWLFKPNPLDNGQAGKVTATDEAGNESQSTNTGAANKEIPDAPVVEQNNESGLLGGTSSPGSTVTLTKPDGSTETAIAGEDGKWSFEPNPLGNGEKGTLTTTDKAGNKSEPIETGLADTIAPEAPSVSQNNNEGLAGKGEAGSTITLTKDDGSKATTVADKDGNWLFKPNPLDNGEAGKVTATDEAGNESQSTNTGAANKEIPDAPVVEQNNESGLLGGTSSPGSTVTLTKPDGSTETTIAGEDGKWKFEPNPLGNGEKGTLTTTDKVGNKSEPIETGIADTIAPDAPEVNQNNNAGLAGKGEAGSTITLTKDDGSKETTVADKDGNWLFKPNPLDNGQAGKVTATDEAGNESSATNTGKADTLAPDVPEVNQNNNAGLAGKGEAGSTITLTKDDGSKETTKADENGNWVFRPNPLENDKEGTVTATDDAGNESKPINTGKADTQAPIISIDHNNKAGLDGTTEPGSTITLKKPDGTTETTIAGEDGKWSFKPNPLDTGENGSLTAVDNAGNQSTSTDTGVPDKSPNAPEVNQNNNAGLGGKADPDSTITLKKPDGTEVTTKADEDGNWSFMPNPLANNQEGTVTATDEAGIVSQPTNTGKADTQAPDAPEVNQNNNAGLAGKGEAGSTITLTKDDGSKVTTTADKDGNWLFKPNPLDNGQEGKVSATDEAGNESKLTDTGAANKEIPDAPIVEQNNESGLLGGTSSPGSTVTLTKPDGSTETTIAGEDGKWKFEPNPLGNGEKGTLTTTDKAGNKSEPIETGLADTIAPEAPSVSQNNNEGLAGKGEAGSTITLTKDDGSKATTVADKDGNWLFKPNPLDNGQAGKVTATDEAGNESKPTDTGAANKEIPDAPVVEQNNESGLLGGTSSPGSTVTLTKPDGSTETTIAGEDGKWKFEPNPLGNGEKGTLTTTDKAGNKSEPIETGLADTIAPEAPSVSQNNNEGLAGKGEAGSTITLTKDDGSKATTVADKDGNWLFKPNPLDNGEAGKVTATDEAGNESQSTNTGAANKEIPDAPVVEQNNESGLLGGTSSPGSTVTLTKPDGSTETTIAGEDGKWKFEPNPLGNGEKGTLTTTDKVGNKSEPIETGIADTIAPDAPEVNQNNNAGLAGKGEAGSTITLTKDDGSKETTVADKDGNWLFKPNPLDNGQAGKVTATDEAGNESSATNTGKADTLAPDVPEVNQNNNGGLAGKGEAGSTITLTKDDGSKETTKADENGNWVFRPNPLENDKEGTVTATDDAGNESKPINTGKADTQAPIINIDHNNAILDGTTEPGSTITLKKPDGSEVTTTADENGNWKFEPNPLGTGENGTLTAIDKAGNISQPTNTGKADTQAPDAPEVNQNNNAGLAGKGEAGSTITLTKDDGSKETTTADKNGNWLFKPNPLDNGQEGKITATDEAGNESIPTNTGKADTQAPDAPEVNQNNNAGLAGKGEVGSTITLTKDDGSKETTKADENGNWIFKPNPLENGQDGKVTATDEAGNESKPTDTGEADKIAPDAPTIDTVYDDVNPETGIISDKGYTNDKTPTLSGKAEANSIVSIYNGDVLLGTAVTNDKGEWTYTPTDELGDGVYSFKVTAQDEHGNASDFSDDYTVNIDTSLPSDNTIAITGISDDTGLDGHDFITNDNTLSFNGELAHALKTNEEVRISLDGGKTWSKATVDGTTWSFDNQNTVLSDGSYTIQVKVTTKAGNYNDSSPQADQVVVIDTQGPDETGLDTTFVITNDTSPGLVEGDDYSHSMTSTNSDLITNAPDIAISGQLSKSLSEGSYLQMSSDGGRTWNIVSIAADNTWTYKLNEFTESATINYQFRVIDGAGNLATNTNFKDNYQVVIDLKSPEGISTAPIIPVSSNENLAVNFNSTTYGKVEAGAIVSIVNDVNKNGSYQEGIDKIIAFTTADADGNWSLDTKLPTGSNQIGFVVWDAAGNRSSLGPITTQTVISGDGSGFEATPQDWGAAFDGSTYGAVTSAVGINSNGNFMFFQNNPVSSGYATGKIYDMKDMINADANGKISYDQIDLARPSDVTTNAYYNNYISSATFVDIDRNGYQDIVAMNSNFWGGNYKPIWLQNADGTWTATAVDFKTAIHYGGMVGFDKTGDGYIDFVSADSSSDSISFLFNTEGTLSVTNILNNSPFKDGNYGLWLQHETSVVDINNDGAVDIVGHMGINNSDFVTDPYNRYLGIFTNNASVGNSASLTEQFNFSFYKNIFNGDGASDYGYLLQSMVWADFDGDGYLDLYIGNGSNLNATNSNEGRIYLNDQNGGLKTGANDIQFFGDNLAAGASLTIDWDHDGKMDVIKMPTSNVTGSPTLYINPGDGNWKNVKGIALDKPGSFTGAVAVDYDWDGAVDIVLYKTGTGVTTVKNTNAVADGTSLHFKILDGEGINAFYGNTINLYDSKGNLVSTQQINAQSSGTNSSTSLVNFYGLDPNETYSLQMLRIVNGVASHVGDGQNFGGKVEGTVNSSWGGLVAGKANEAHVLTAEADGQSITTIGDGIIGTGYNDTFVAAAGTRTYNGGGGWSHNPIGSSKWSETDGLDTMDYSAVNSGMTIDLSKSKATSADGLYNHTLNNIEGIIGSSQADTITSKGHGVNGVFEGGAGNDTFNLTSGAQDSLIYKVLSGALTDATGGNGHDEVNGFHVGNIVSDKDADILDVGELLDYKGSISFYMQGSEMKLDFNSREILDYLKVEIKGNDTVISINRDGEGSENGYTELVTLKDTQTDLVTLLFNNQISI